MNRIDWKWIVYMISLSFILMAIFIFLVWHSSATNWLISSFALSAGSLITMFSFKYTRRWFFKDSNKS